ncbi:MAG: helix-turn-helix domain-containing protein [Thermoleophilia bacterium]|nr:helix-turn-helix domain-containing protein [Thermoleophilia bacterium]
MPDEAPQGPDAETLRHRALAGSARVRILAALRAAEGALDARALARAVGLHVSTIRWHLGVLAAAGLVVAATEERTRPGRPRKVYRPAGAGRAADAPAALLAELLADCLARAAPAAARLSEAAGRARGRALVGARGLPGPAPDRVALLELVGILDGLGFHPELRATRQPTRILMRPCPFGDVAAAYPTIVCPAHLGLMRGALDALGAAVTVERLDPYAEPDRCVASLGSGR